MIVGDNPALMTELWWAVSLWSHVTLFIIGDRLLLLFRYSSIFNLTIDLHRAFRIAPLRSTRI